MLKHLPNTLTCGNVLSGSLGILFIFKGRPDLAVYMVWAGAIFDFLDGLVARLVNAASPIGKELDSLADMVTFGALPGFFLYEIIRVQDETLAYVALLIIVFSALRLAKFNVDTRQSENFIGLPTPSNALFFTSLPFLMQLEAFSFLNNPWVLAALAVIFSLLLVSELPLLSLKFKGLDPGKNKFRFLLLGGAVVILAVFRLSGLSLTIIWYILLSLVWNLTTHKHVKHTE